ncbi:hypothetical protein RclHR1_11130004 [Rhizophagus clarus]|uniref:Uncharacterized protein n=1 Tax=Rhizophagus clarus TaxID=94130 RepID=A0A2Z6Q3S3_9GLOM|nr:hypothetical protein RclHR1_11130004 [Rhizophagus clarus]GES81671.1 hypothetical protein GLOIN_2v1835445 [Rhizophagus clarus]
MKERNTDGIESSICPRCEKEEETWEHIWKCEENEISLRNTIEDAIYLKCEVLEKEGKNEKVEIIKDILSPFTEILFGDSIILIRKTREWELLRGIFNNKFNDITKKKEEQLIIKELWGAIYDHIKNTIWIKRCNTVIAIEKDKGISKTDKRRRVEETEIDKGNKKKKTKTKENQENQKTKTENKIKLVTRDKLIGITTKGSINNNWYTTMKID